MLKCRYSGPEAVLHLRVGAPNVLIVRGGASLDVGLCVTADAGGAESNVALF